MTPSAVAIPEDYYRFDWRQEVLASGQREDEEKRQPDYSSVREDDPYFCTHRNDICGKSGISAKTCEVEMKACVGKH